MRTAAVVIPVCTIAGTASLMAIGALAHRPAPPTPRSSAGEPPPAVVPIIKPPPASPPKYGGPVGDQFLGEQSDLLIGKGEGPPMLFMLTADDLNSNRYGWRMPRVARLMAEELASVLDDGCDAGCPKPAQTARTAAHDFVDEFDHFDAPARTRNWVKDVDGIRTSMHQLTIRSRAAGLTIDVTCTCASWTVGMRMWNDITTCEAQLRDKGRVIATYVPQLLTMSDKESVEEPVDAWNQIVTLPGGATLVTETGWSYSGDNVNTPLTKTTPRTGPHWR